MFRRVRLPLPRMHRDGKGGSLPGLRTAGPVPPRVSGPGLETDHPSAENAALAADSLGEGSEEAVAATAAAEAAEATLADGNESDATSSTLADGSEWACKSCQTRCR